MRTRLVFHWADIAIEQERLALKGRADVERTHQAGETPYKLKAELHPALIAIAACAHSLEALVAELEEILGHARRRGKRPAQIAGMLELAVDRDVDQWRPRLRMLFAELRNPAVHPEAKDSAPERHPVLPTNVPPEYAIYTVEAVGESVDLLLEILSACVEAPRPPIEAWANDSRPNVEGLKQSRRSLKG